MSAVKVLARDWVLEVSVGGVWTIVKGLNSISFSGTKTNADTTSFDENGWESHLPARRGRSLTVEAFYLEDPSNGARDAGQSAIEQANEGIGHTGFADFRLISPGFVARTFEGSVNVSDSIGGTDDPTSFNFGIDVNGLIGKTVLEPAKLTTLTDDLTASLDPTFDPDTYDYTLAATNAEDEVTFTATADGTVSGAGTIPLAVGPNLIQIYVSEAGKATTVYNILVTRA